MTVIQPTIARLSIKAPANIKINPAITVITSELFIYFRYHMQLYPFPSFVLMNDSIIFCHHCYFLAMSNPLDSTASITTNDISIIIIAIATSTEE